MSSKNHNSAVPQRIHGIKIDGLVTKVISNHQFEMSTFISLTSDDPQFHGAIEGFTGVIRSFNSETHKKMLSCKTFLMVIKDSGVSNIWIDNTEIRMQFISKKSLKSGSPVFEEDIADILSMDFQKVDILQNDQVVYIFRVGWKFAIFCDFNPEKNFNKYRMEITLGRLYREMKFFPVYQAVKMRSGFDDLIKLGWFPFVEIINQYSKIFEYHNSGIDISVMERKICDEITNEHLDRMLNRWLSKKPLIPRKALLESAIEDFKNTRPIAVIKTLMTEIEGIINDSFKDKHGTGAKSKALIQHAIESGKDRTGCADSLLLPDEFKNYLSNYIFANFDPTTGAGITVARHAVGHGAALTDSYTMPRALQVILTIDQLSFYL